MSELKIVVPVELKVGNKKAFQGEVTGIPTKNSVTLKVGNAKAFKQEIENLKSKANVTLVAKSQEFKAAVEKLDPKVKATVEVGNASQFKQAVQGTKPVVKATLQVANKKQFEKSAGAIKPTVKVKTQINKKDLNAQVSSAKPSVSVAVRVNGKQLESAISKAGKKVGTSGEQYSKYLAGIEAKLERIRWLRDNFGRANKNPVWAGSLNKVDEGLLNLKGADINMDRFQQLSKELSTLEAQARAAGMAGKTLGQRWSESMAKFGSWMSVSTVFMEATQRIREMYDNTMAVNTAMTDLRKVTSETERSYRQYLTASAGRSADMSTRLTDYIGGTTEWARLGESLGSATKLGEISAMYYNVGDGIDSVSDATLKLNSALKAFNLDASQAMYVMDMLNHVGKLCPNIQ